MVRDVEADAWSDRHIFLINQWSEIKSNARNAMRLLRFV